MNNMKNLFFLNPMNLEILLLLVTAKGQCEDVAGKLQGHIDNFPANWIFDSLSDAQYKQNSLMRLALM
jgi:hypothetical protein